MTECEVLNELRKNGEVSVGFPVLSGKRKEEYYHKQLSKEEEAKVRAEWKELDRIIKKQMKKMRCETCEWWQFEEIDKGHICCNAKSPKCADWTEKDYVCSYWEKKKKGKKKV